MEITSRPVGFEEQHELYRDQVRRFIANEIAPHHERWEREGMVDRELWRKAGAAGLLCPSLSNEYGGPGGDFLHSVVVIEELGYAGTTGPGFAIHSEMAAPYLSAFGTEAQKQRWLPRLASGEVVAAIAMTEPDAGSDLRGMRTEAERVNGGWRVNGQKVFISNGQLADLVIVAAKVDRGDKNSITLFLIDAGSPGFRRGSKLDKIGNRAQDTSELFFDGVFVPDDGVLGEPKDGFRQLMHGLVRERLCAALSCQSRAEAALDTTLEYVKQRKVFGKALVEYQNSRFKLAELKAEVAVGRAYVDQLLKRYLDGGANEVDAAIAKLWISEMLGRVVDACLQMHGGWGYMRDYPIARAYVDARVARILAGSSEIMKEIISRSLIRSERG